MSASGLLASWRARWHKAGEASWRVANPSGRTSRAIDRLARSRVWRLRLTTPASLLLGAGLMLFGIVAPLSANGQIVFAALLLMFAILMRRVDNPGLRLTLAYLSALASWRYFFWRLDTTLPWDSWGLALGMLLWATEVLAWAVVAFEEASPLWLLQASEASPAARFIGRARHVLTGFSGVLRFYRPVALAVGVVVPGLCLMLAREPLVTTVPTLAAFALPHLALQRLARLTLPGGGRIPMRRLLHEWLLEGIMLWRTASSFAWTMLRNLGSPTIRSSAGRLPNPALPGSIWRIEGAILLFQLAAVGAWIHQSWDADHEVPGIEGLLLAWCALNALSCLARLAQLKERALVASQLAQRARQPALLVLGPGRVIRGETDNFPQTRLKILARPWPLRGTARTPAPGDTVGVSVFYREFEQTFSATIDAVSDTGVTLRIVAADLDSYEAYGAAVFSRESLWPAWLAPDKADRILPAGLHRLIDALEAFFYDFFVVRKGLQTLLQRLLFWRQARPPASGS